MQLKTHRTKLLKGMCKKPWGDVSYVCLRGHSCEPNIWTNIHFDFQVLLHDCICNNTHCCSTNHCKSDAVIVTIKNRKRGYEGVGPQTQSNARCKQLKLIYFGVLAAGAKDFTNFWPQAQRNQEQQRPLESPRTPPRPLTFSSMLYEASVKTLHSFTVEASTLFGPAFFSLSSMSSNSCASSSSTMFVKL